jgi:fatty acid/phospholipid biosynthesis enzyme
VGGALSGAARSGVVSALGGLLMYRSLKRLRHDLNPDTTGGAILLGLRAVTVIAHMMLVCCMERSISCDCFKLTSH